MFAVITLLGILRTVTVAMTMMLPDSVVRNTSSSSKTNTMNKSRDINTKPKPM